MPIVLQCRRVRVTIKMKITIRGTEVEGVLCVRFFRFLFFCCCLSCPYLAFTGKSKQEQIEAAICAKFESSEPGSRVFLFYHAEAMFLAGFVYGLDLVECDIPVSDWQYRVTYNCNEICPTCQEIVVLVGDGSLSIDGVLYTSKPELPFQKVLEYFRDKYAYYCQNQ